MIYNQQIIDKGNFIRHIKYGKHRQVDDEKMNMGGKSLESRRFPLVRKPPCTCNLKDWNADCVRSIITQSINTKTTYLVGGFNPTPLKNDGEKYDGELVTVGMMTFHFPTVSWKVLQNSMVPNHQQPD